MTTRTDRIRQHLERHGYFDDEAFGLRGPKMESFFSWNGPLDHFLRDASKTGARIQDLIDHGPGKEIGPVCIYGTGYFDDEDPTDEPKHWHGYCAYASDAPAPTGDAKTVDESVSQLWRRVFIDPEDTP